MDTMVLDLNLMSEIPKHVDGSKAAWLAQEMVKIPSLPGEEANLALFLADYLRGLGMEVQVQDVLASKQVIGRYRGSDGRPSLMFNGHMDHNPPILGWTKDPYGGIVEDGWLYGAGAVNMKGGDAAMITAAAAVHNSGIRLKGDLMVSCVMGELMGGLGTRHMLESGIVPDMAIVTEPTDLNLRTKHPGVFQGLIHTYGKIRHFSAGDLHKGIHALEKMVKIINALGPSMTPLTPGSWLKFKPHPDFPGFPQFNIGTINAGLGKDYKKRPTLMPDLCTITFDCRFIPGMSVESIKRDLEAVIEKLKKEDLDLKVEIDTPIPGFLNMPAYEISHDDSLVTTLVKWHQYVTNTKPEMGGKVAGRIGGATDAGHFYEKRVKAVVYGPGGRFVNIPDERLRVDDIINGAKILALVAGDICS